MMSSLRDFGLARMKEKRPQKRTRVIDRINRMNRIECPFFLCPSPLGGERSGLKYGAVFVWDFGLARMKEK
jgi:hypothetical protein